MREPVSISAVAMIVSEPPSSILRAAPKKRFGRCKAFESIPPERILPLGGTTVLCARARRVIESSRITTSRLCSTNPLALSIPTLQRRAGRPPCAPPGAPGVALGRLVERARDDFALHRALHVGDLLGALVDQQHDEHDLGVVLGD